MAPEGDSELQPVEPSTDAVRPEEIPMAPGVIPLWRLYVAAAGTFCLYLTVWTYRTARQYGFDKEYRHTPVWWAIGTLISPVAACVLFEFNRRARAFTGRPRPAAGPALALVALSLAWGFTPLGHYVLAIPILGPLPFLAVQRNINRTARQGIATTHPPRPLRVPLAVGAVLGLPVLAMIGWWVDLPTFDMEMAQRLTGGARVVGRSEVYGLTMPTTDWRELSPGTIGDPESDMELVGPGFDTWVVIYTTPTTENDLESAIGIRREMIFAEGTTAGYKERRYFLSDEELFPVSFATYRVSFGVAGLSEYQVLTAELEDHVIEILGHTAEPATHSKEVRDLLRTFSVESTGEER